MLISQQCKLYLGVNAPVPVTTFEVAAVVVPVTKVAQLAKLDKAADLAKAADTINDADKLGDVGRVACVIAIMNKLLSLFHRNPIVTAHALYVTNIAYSAKYI